MQEKVNEITLASCGAWHGADDAAYIQCLKRLQTGYTELLLAHTVGTPEIYRGVFLWNDSVASLKPKLYDLLATDGLRLWNEFAGGALEHSLRK